MNHQIAVQPDPAVKASAGADGLDHLVARAWNRTLCRRSYERAARDVFGMRLGSRPVYKFLAEIEEVTGVSLPYTALLQAPTLGAFTELVRLGRPPAFDPLVPFRPQGEAAPLFILPGIGGSVFQLLDLARAVRHPGPVYLNQQAGLDREHAAHTTIADMAAFQVTAIRRQQPQGPYLILGYSLGALVALEVGRRLIEDGHDVPFIGMIEPGLPETVWPLAVRAQFLASRLRHHWTSVHRLGWRQALAYGKARIAPLLGRVGRMLGTQALGKSAYQSDVVNPELTKLISASTEAYFKYKPRKFLRQVYLFQSELGDPLDCHPLRIWPRYLSRFEVSHVPGDHKTVLRDRNAVLLAAEVSKHLAAARGATIAD